MKELLGAVQTVILCVAVCPGASLANSNADYANPLVNRIEGSVWGPDRRPVRDLYVELQSEYFSFVGRTRTDSSGRFRFAGISRGYYIVKVLTSGTNYLEYSENVTIGNVIGSSDSVSLEIYLKLDKRKMNAGPGAVVEAVFVQEVPDEARKLYKRGAKHLQESRDSGLNEIETALKIFPDYFDALNTLGTAYVARKEYQKSLPYLIKAIEVNQRSFSSFYALAYACDKLEHRPEAMEAARGATMLQPNSINAQLLYGTLLRIDRSYEKAEKALLEAKKLGQDRPVAEVHWQLALLYNKLGRNREAADELESYLKMQPDARDRKEIQALITKLRKEPKQKFADVIRSNR